MTDLVDVLRESRQRGFLGPGPVEDHLDHARAFAVVAEMAPPTPSHVCDLGAGGGLPGLILATESWPDTRWTFLDAQQRRTEFLAEAVDALGLRGRVEVVTARAEELGRDEDHRGRYDLVVSRSFGPPAVTAECAAPLLEVGGRLIVSEPPAQRSSARWPGPGLAELGLSEPEAHLVSREDDVHLVCLRQLSACGDRYPRRVGVPVKRPLF